MLGQQKSVGISGCNNDTWLANIVINERFILWNSGGSGFEAMKHFLLKLFKPKVY